MALDQIIASIDAEISQLKQARALLTGASVRNDVQPVRKRRTLSAAARKKIAEAQRKRWARQKGFEIDGRWFARRGTNPTKQSETM